MAAERGAVGVAVLMVTGNAETAVGVSIADLSIAYADRQRRTEALSDVSFRVLPGETVAILGPSGCGKTTLLKAVAGILRPTSGTIEFSGGSAANKAPECGMVFQAPTLLPWRTVLNNVLLPVEVEEGEVTKEWVEKAAKLVQEVGLAQFADAYPSQLSGGMQQRVALARALLRDPAMLLLDEPFGSLDEPTRRRLGELVSAIIQRRNVTCMFVTHDVDEAVFLGDRVVLLSDRPGRVKQVLPVPLPHPRRLGFWDAPAFLKAVSVLRSSLVRPQGDSATQPRWTLEE